MLDNNEATSDDERMNNNKMMNRSQKDVHNPDKRKNW